MDPKLTFHLVEDAGLPPMTGAAALAVAACALSVAAVVLILWRRPYWFLHPTLPVFALYVARVQFPSLFYLGEAIERLPDPWHYPLIIHLFAILFLVLALPIYFLTDASYRAIWERIRAQVAAGEVMPRRLFMVSLGLMCGVLVVYFLVHPFTSTALYMMFTRPGEITAARETSWKLLPSRALVYAYSWSYNTFAPLVICGATAQILRKRQPAYVFALLLAVFAMMLGLHRAALGLAAITCLSTYYLISRRRILPTTRTLVIIVLALAITCVQAGYITVLREGRDVTTDNLVEASKRILLGRILMEPAHTIRLYCYYAQQRGYTGSGGVRPLSWFTGAEYVNLPNEIGRRYISGGGPTTVCNTNFVGTYYASFGLLTIAISVFGLLAFELLGLVYYFRRLAVVPFCVLFWLKAIHLAEGQFTSMFVTGGYFWVVVLVPFGLVAAKSLVRPAAGTRWVPATYKPGLGGARR